MSEIFRMPIEIAPSDIDELGHVNNIVYLRWAQEIAIAHWRARAEPDWIARYVWVAVRHEIDYRAALKLGDEAEVRTWVDDAGSRGALWARFVEVARLGAEKPAASLRSDWCIVDAKSHRPRRVLQEIVARFLA